ncbi:MAG: hypothetical protein HN368_08535 [Spirochaetales bacterium]|jgi:hypothetical protein|nr:hypothetical protein [Spirochaetales bacterium]
MDLIIASDGCKYVLLGNFRRNEIDIFETADPRPDKIDRHREIRKKSVEGDELPDRDGIALQGTQGFAITGNAIFSWPAAGPMRHGIFEDEPSADNTFGGSNINFCVAESILSKETGSMIGENSAAPRVPFAGNMACLDPDHRLCQMFDPCLVEEFIKEEVG